MTLTDHGAHARASVPGQPNQLAPVSVGSARTGRLGWPALVLAGLYLLAVALLFASHVREFADETDNLLGGVLLARGARLYVDFFSSHMPLAYYLAAIPARLGVTTLEHFRLVTNALLVLATLGIASSFRTTLPPLVLAIWAITTVYAHTLQFGEMLTAGTCAGYGVLVAGLVFYTTPDLRFSPRQVLVLSAACFVAVQSELVAVFPLILLGVCFIAVRLAAARRTSLAHEARAILGLGLAVALPNLLVVLGFLLTGILGEFVYDAYQFNQAFYSQYLMNASVVGMLHDWEAQYRTYLIDSLRDPLGVQSCLVLANVFATWLVYRSRGLPVALVYYLFIALSHVRNEWAYYLESYFSLALALAWAVGQLRRLSAPRPLGGKVAPALVVLLALDFAVQVGFTYDLSTRPARDQTDVDIVLALSSPGDRLFVAPFDPYMYLATDRMPASSLSFYFPWQAIDPRMEARLFDDLASQRPPVVIFRGWERVNDRWLTSGYAQRLYEFLLSQDYAPLDAASPGLGDVLVPRDRLALSRQRLGV
jgi:hypothetical protein